MCVPSGVNGCKARGQPLGTGNGHVAAWRNTGAGVATGGDPAKGVGNFSLRGGVSNADPASDLPAAFAAWSLLALDVVLAFVCVFAVTLPAL